MLTIATALLAQGTLKSSTALGRWGMMMRILIVFVVSSGNPLRHQYLWSFERLQLRLRHHLPSCPPSGGHGWNEGVLFDLGNSGRSAAQVWHDTWPWFAGSLATMLTTGFLLFPSEAVKLYYHDAFWVKMSALLAALVFTAMVERPTALADPERVTPWRS